MGLAIDATGLQFKLLNKSRGAAVWSPRAQADKRAYSRWMREKLESHPRIEWVLGRAGRILVENGRVCGLALEEGGIYGCRAVVITTGTFLNGLIHVGLDQRPAGRAGEPPTHDLANSLKSFGFQWGRLKTGTPPRLARQSIRFDESIARGVFHVEHGDPVPTPFSYTATTNPQNHIVCHLLHTTEHVHELVKAHISESPLFNGQIRGVGPRYCPSLAISCIWNPRVSRSKKFTSMAFR
jgi:tRNA uridine 5-carboxymethylaminomethyl modification enzyme